jgi:hypothetical protein
MRALTFTDHFLKILLYTLPTYSSFFFPFCFSLFLFPPLSSVIPSLPFAMEPLLIFYFTDPRFVYFKVPCTV